MARNVIDADEALHQIHIDVSQDTQEDMKLSLGTMFYFN